MAVRGSLESLIDWVVASFTMKTCFTSPFACLEDFISPQNDFSSSSKAGVLSSSMEAMLGKLNGLLLGVEQEGLSTYNEAKKIHYLG